MTMSIPRASALASRAGRAVVLSAWLSLGVCLAQTPLPPPPPLPGSPMLTIGLQEADTPLSAISVAVITEAFRRARVGLAFRRMSLAREIESANAGEIDGDLHRIAMVAPKYPNLMLVPTPINRVDVAIYGADPSIITKTREEIGRMSVALQRGIFVLSKYNTSPNATESQTVAGALEMVLDRHVDVAMLTFVDVEARTSPPRARDMVRWPYLWASEPMYLLLHRRNEALVPQLNAALLQMSKEGLIDGLYWQELARHDIKSLAPEPRSGEGKRAKP